jgi:UDP-N-acetylmuramoyl-tripeptide--D-alanyl-D-alanine ligase
MTKWGEITVEEILSPMRGELITGPKESCLTGLSTDTREVTPGQLFWALKGERHDGHDYIQSAVEKGASGIVINKDYKPEILQRNDCAVITVNDTLEALGDLARWWRDKHSVRVAVITGSVGKSTTKEMAASILGLRAETLKNRGNLNNLVGLPLTIFQLTENHKRAVLEMGMNQPGEIARLTEIANPDVGLITNVARAHLEGVGSIDGVAKAKVELLEKISSDGRVLLNGDDELLMRAASPFGRKVTTYGLGSGNEIRAENIRNLGREGVSFELRYDGNSISIRIRVPGVQNVVNALAASAIAISMKESPDTIVKGLNSFEGMYGRFMLVPLPNNVTLVDDTYNSNPASLKAAIDSLKELIAVRGRVIVGLGEMLELGDETLSAHREAGGMVADLGAYFFLAMGEHAREMVDGAVGRGFPPERARVVDTHQEMGQQIKEIMKQGDLILLKGSRRVGLERVSQMLKGNIRAHSK